MKKTALVIIALAVIASAAYAATGAVVLNWKVANLTTTAGVVNGATSSTTDLLTPYSKHTVTATWQGAAPNWMEFDVEGSIDCSTSFYTLSRSVMTASPYTHHIADKPVQCLRVTVRTQNGGTLGATKLFVNSVSGGN